MEVQAKPIEVISPGRPLRPDSPELADRAASWRSAYVHIPFCARVCPYCDFAVVAGRDDAQHRYLGAVATEIEMEAPWQPLDAVYFGGGTPSRIPATGLKNIIDGLRRRFGFGDQVEISLEANPEDWTAEYASALYNAGFRRVSFGAQSFQQPVLAALGRCHQPTDIKAGVRAARRAGFESINLDLILGTPGESPSEWRDSIEQALALQPDHISCYALTVERGTELSRRISAGEAAPDPDLQADGYEVACDLLEQAGLVRYEVSNWAGPGHESRYNLSVWGQGEYLAFGNGAHSHRDGGRRRNFRGLTPYLKAVESGQSPVRGEDRLSPWQREQERLLLGLRRAAGVQSGRAGRALLISDWGRRLVEAGVIAEQDGRITVVRPLLTDEVSRAILDLTDDWRLMTED